MSSVSIEKDERHEKRRSKNLMHPETLTQKLGAWQQKQLPEDGVLYKKVALKKFAKFTGKHLCGSLFWYRCRYQAYNFTKKQTSIKVFSCGFY